MWKSPKALEAVTQSYVSKNKNNKNSYHDSLLVCCFTLTLTMTIFYKVCRARLVCSMQYAFFCTIHSCFIDYCQINFIQSRLSVNIVSNIISAVSRRPLHLFTPEWLQDILCFITNLFTTTSNDQRSSEEMAK